MDIISDKKVDWPQPRRFDSEDEFVAWCDEDTNAEYVRGEVIMVPPASLDHDDRLTWFGASLRLFVEKKDLGKVWSTGNIQVRLRPEIRRNPDVVFLSKERLHLSQQNHIDGAPDLVAEFVSPESTARDWHDKFQEYEAAGVREYWIIDQQLNRLDVYLLGEDGRYHLLEETDGKVFSKVLTGFWVKPNWFWQMPLPGVHEIAKEIGIIP